MNAVALRATEMVDTENFLKARRADTVVITQATNFLKLQNSSRARPGREGSRKILRDYAEL
jgi:hypothetical protein